MRSGAESARCPLLQAAAARPARGPRGMPTTQTGPCARAGRRRGSHRRSSSMPAQARSAVDDVRARAIRPGSRRQKRGSPGCVTRRRRRLRREPGSTRRPRSTRCRSQRVARSMSAALGHAGLEQPSDPAVSPRDDRRPWSARLAVAVAVVDPEATAVGWYVACRSSRRRGRSRTASSAGSGTSVARDRRRPSSRRSSTPVRFLRHGAERRVAAGLLDRAPSGTVKSPRRPRLPADTIASSTFGDRFAPLVEGRSSRRQGPAAFSPPAIT